MKENKVINEAFVQFHEDMSAQGKTPKEIETLAIKQFNLGGSDPGHTYRAMKARLADPKKYGGIYSERMKRFQRLPNKKKESATDKTNGEAENTVPETATATPTVVETTDEVVVASTTG